MGPVRPEVDAVFGIPPTVAIEQRLSRGGRKSTVATTTEVWHFLRLLYVKLGIQHCVNDGAEVRPQTPDSIAALTKYMNSEDTKDPWGNEYQMLCGDQASEIKDHFGVRSNGDDGKAGTADDIKSWEKPPAE